MGQEHAPLSAQALTILRLIAAGRSYDQILLQHPDLRYQDIFAAAQETLTWLERQGHLADWPTAASHDPGASATPIRPRLDGPIPPIQPERDPARAPATERRSPIVAHAPVTPTDPAAPWTLEEDAQLERLYRRGAHLAEIGQALGRHHGTIRERLVRLGLDADRDDDLTSFENGGPGGHGTPPPAPRSSAAWDAIRRRLEGHPEAD